MISWTTRNGEVENKLEKDWDKLDLWVLGYGEGEDGKLVENFLPWLTKILSLYFGEIIEGERIVTVNDQTTPSSCLTCARLTLLLLLFLAMCFLGMGVVMVQVISSFVFFFFFYFYFLERVLARCDIYSFHSFFRHNLSFLMNLGDCLLFNFFWLVVCHSFFNWTLFF